MEHHAIDDAAVIGKIASDGNGEVPIAFAVRKPDEKLLESHVKDFLATRLAKYKMVDEVYFVDRIPRNTGGKILRRVLHESLKRMRQIPNDQPAVATAYKAALQELDHNQRRRTCSANDFAKLDKSLGSEKLGQLV